VSVAAPTEGDARREERRLVWSRFRQSRPGMIGLVLLAVFLVMALAYPILIRTVWDPDIYDPEFGLDLVQVDKVVVTEITDSRTQVEYADAVQRNPAIRPGDVVPGPVGAGFGLDHLLSTDHAGRDILAMLLAGAAPAMAIAVSAAITTAVVAIAIAALSAYYKGPVDAVFSSTSNALLLLPAPLVMIILGTSRFREAFNPVGFGILYGLLVGGGAVAIVVRSEAYTTMNKGFIDSARTSGAGSGRIIGRHLVPDLLPIASVSILVGITGAIVADAFIAFTGFGPNRFSWGTMLSWAIAFPDLLGPVPTPWNVLIVGGVAISLLAASFYLVAIGIHIAFDTPKR
jgi:ABC-type dipeptide/oligopeptide/nickel transport system permease subunit